MTTQEIANQVVDLLRAGQFEAVYDQFFDAENIHHIEPQSPHFPDLKGVKALKEKDAQIQANIASFDHLEVGDAIVSKDYIALPYKAAFTTKDGQQAQLDELIVYQVKGDKIISEQFFY